MIRAWRIVKAKHASTAFSGDGAKAYGGRWNSAGIAVVYVAGGASLAMLETLVHVRSRELLKRYVIFPVTFDEGIVTSIDITDLPGNWRKSPPPRAVQRMGDEWFRGAKSAVLRVPSVVVPTEWNYVINPSHPDFAEITIEGKRAVQFDSRLIKGGDS